MARFKAFLSTASKEDIKSLRMSGARVVASASKDDGGPEILVIAVPNAEKFWRRFEGTPSAERVILQKQPS